MKKDRFLKEFTEAISELKQAEKGKITLQDTDSMIAELKTRQCGIKPPDMQLHGLVVK